MYKNTINGTEVIAITPQKEGGYVADGKLIHPDMIMVRKGLYHVIIGGRSAEAEIISANTEEKTFHIRVNGNIYQVKVTDRYDELLQEMGMDIAASKKVSDLKAPMPGLVADVCVEEGQAIKKGDKLLVLEAMKMENILKAPDDLVVKKVHAKKGRTVEKNEVLITFA